MATSSLRGAMSPLFPMRSKGLLAAVRLPDPNRLIQGGAGQAFAVGAEGHTIDLFGLALEGYVTCTTKAVDIVPLPAPTSGWALQEQLLRSDVFLFLPLRQCQGHPPQIQDLIQLLSGFGLSLGSL